MGTTAPPPLGGSTEHTTITIPYSLHPDIVTRIFELGDICTWTTLRPASRAFRARADALIFAHLGVWADEGRDTTTLNVPIDGAHFVPTSPSHLGSVRILTLVGPLRARHLRKPPLRRALPNVHTLRIYHEHRYEVDPAPLHQLAQTVLVVTPMTGRNSFAQLDTPEGARRLVVNFKYETCAPVLPGPGLSVPYTVSELVLLFTNTTPRSCSHSSVSPSQAASSTYTPGNSPAMGRIVTLVQFAALYNRLTRLTVVGLHEVHRAWLAIPADLGREEVERLFLCVVASKMGARWVDPSGNEGAGMADACERGQLADILDEAEPEIKDVLACITFVSTAEYRNASPHEFALVTEL